MTYFSFEDGNEHGSFEVWYNDSNIGPECLRGANGERMPDGWYWWACFPGCLPDGVHRGPFTTEQEAIEDAQS